MKNIENARYRTCFTRFRLSNHNLMIEKGRHFKPKIDKELRFCPFCKTTIENEVHFLMYCPLYSPERSKLEKTCNENCNIYDSLTREQKFIFIFNLANENKSILVALAKFVHNSMTLRDTLMEYFMMQEK